MSEDEKGLRRYVYEVIDATNDEEYWSQGLFDTLEQAIKFCTDWEVTGDPPLPESPDVDEVVVLEIRKRAVGRVESHVEVWSRTWEQTFNDEGDQWVEVKQ